MQSHKIRTKFLEFFAQKGHEIVPSDSLVPKNDPTLLFTSAGMNQFKEQFLGRNVTYKRAASSQKCLRTADLERVGKTPSHHTFFEMLGNFSFGDYFKEDAILWAWEFLTKALGIKKEKLWVSVYKDDRESFDIWKDKIKVPAKKIKKLGPKDNFWPANAPKDGPNGPCGPCSEIFYGSVEVWNLVFTEFNRAEGGKLTPLPNKNIDTGMGLERIAAVMQGVKTNFETDLFKPITEDLGIKNKNTVADHIRAVTFAISDGVTPSNEERGYVIRKLIRRAHLIGGKTEPFLYDLVPKVVNVMKGAYPELRDKMEESVLIVKEEEEKFRNTLELAMPILKESIRKKRLSGEAIFKLIDTYGLPLDVIKAKARGVKIDIPGFERLMEKQRRRSRKKSKIGKDIFACGLSEETPEAAKNHTATHLLQSALRKVLGEHVHQAGSLVTPERLRFDFTHVKKLTERELEKVESLVNECVKKAVPVTKEEKALNEAKAEGAIALFGEKYKDRVKVVTAGGFSKEVCGGIHVDNTSEIGLFKIVRESSIASGVRRIEAVTGSKAREWIKESEKSKAESAERENRKEEKKRHEKEKLKAAEVNIETLKQKKVIIEKIEGADAGVLRNLADKITRAGKTSFVLLVSSDEGKASLVLALGKEAVSKGFSAAKIIKKMAGIVGGSGGGREDFAQAGGKDSSKLDEVFKMAEKLANEIS